MRRIGLALVVLLAVGQADATPLFNKKKKNEARKSDYVPKPKHVRNENLPELFSDEVWKHLGNLVKEEKQRLTSAQWNQAELTINRRVKDTKYMSSIEGIWAGEAQNLARGILDDFVAKTRKPR